MKNKERLRNRHRPEETRDITTECIANKLNKLNCRTEKGHWWRKSGEIQKSLELS